MAETKNNFSNLSKLKTERQGLYSFAENIKNVKKELTQLYNKSFNKLSQLKKEKIEKAKAAEVKAQEKPIETVSTTVVDVKVPEKKEEAQPEKRIFYPNNNLNGRNKFDNRQNFAQRQNFNGQNGRPSFQRGSFDNRQNPRFASQNGRPNFQKTGFNKPFGPKPGFAKKQTLEPLPDFIKQAGRTPDKKKKEFDNNGEKKTLSVKQKMRFGLIVDEYANDERMGSRKLKVKKEKQETKVAELLTHAVITSDNLTVKDFSETISRPVSEIIKQLMLLGQMKTINSSIDFDTAELVASELGVTLEKKVEKSFEEKMRESRTSQSENNEKRPPIVTVMGHVDHGKTSLLDAIRKTNVIEGEAGGITQHIGAYSINYNGEKITFIDTPGHAAFSKMRARGAQVTDIAILVVAANDGIMPQTVESIKQIKLAGVPMIVAINKIDLVDANIDRVKQQLAENDVIPEEWGGDAICVPISAKQCKGIDKLIETILLVSEMSELKADPNKDGQGVVLEAKLDKTRGAIANLIVQDGTLSVGDTLVAGTAFGKIKAMFDENGAVVKKAGPSTPVSVLGLDGVPSAGDYFFAVDEKLSKQVIEERKNKIKLDRIKKASTSLDDFYARVDAGKLKQFNVIIKSDVQGSSEALEASLTMLSNEEVRVNVISASAGSITENDVEMAANSNAIIVAFNIKVDGKIETVAKKAKVEIKSYKIIYKAIEEIEEMIKALKEPVYEQEYLGKAEIRLVFKLSSGTIAGSYVQDGKIERGAKAKVLRGGQEVFSGQIESVKIGKDDKKEVTMGFECGIKLQGFTDFKEGDVIECFKLVEVK